MRPWLSATASTGATRTGALPSLATLASLPALATLTLKLSGLDSGRRRSSFEARRRPALAGLPAACAALASLLIGGRFARRRLDAARRRLCATCSWLGAASGRLRTACADAALTVGWRTLATRTSGSLASGLGRGSCLRLGLGDIGHDLLARLQTGDDFD